jgi:sialic acid synthase SpsE
VSVAKDLIDAAADAGADVVKFQTFDVNSLLSPDTAKPSYQEGRSQGERQADWLRDVQFGHRELQTLLAYCEEVGIEFLSTPYGPESVALLEELGLDWLKIASADLVNRPLLLTAAEAVDSLIISTGMATIDEIARSVGWLREFDEIDVTLLHCVSAYPTAFPDVNMRFMQTLNRAFDIPVGYSDHTLGTEAPVMAVSLGAVMLEKHLTLDRGMAGPDHEVSLEPDEFEQMVTQIRNVEAARGDRIKKISDEEQENAALMRQSVHAATDLQRGTRLSETDLTIARPNDGIEPAAVTDILGRKVTTDLRHGDPITQEDLT